MVFLATGRTNESWQTARLPAVSSHHRCELFSPVLWDYRFVQNLSDLLLLPLLTFSFFFFFNLLQLCDLLQYTRLMEVFIFLLASQIFHTRFPSKISDGSCGPGDRSQL